MSFDTTDAASLMTLGAFALVYFAACLVQLVVLFRCTSSSCATCAAAAEFTNPKETT